MKCALDIGNSSVKGMLLTDKNTVISPLRFPSSCVNVPDAKYLTFETDEDIYIQVIESDLAHFEDVVAIGQKAIDMPEHQRLTRPITQSQQVYCLVLLHLISMVIWMSN